jgi:6-phosphogluconolactonase
MDEETGALTHQGDVSAPGRPAPIAVDPQQKFMYVARRDDLQINSYRINASDGDLIEIGSIPIPTDPCHMAMDQTGKFLLSAHYMGARAMVHRVGNNGALEADPAEDFHTAIGSHCFQTDRSNRFAFVPHIDNRGGANAIFQFKFDELTGKLKPNSPARVPQNKNVGPRHFCIHPSLDIFYFSNEQGSSISTYDFDRNSGHLSLIQTVSNLPKEWARFSKCSQILIIPNGRYLYAPNRGNDTIAEYEVDPVTGLLTPLGHTPSQEIPRVFDIDPAAKFLLSAGLYDGKVGVFRITENGKLKKTAAYDVGEEPMWVTILNSP